jgi:signal transduction histidine kinase
LPVLLARFIFCLVFFATFAINAGNFLDPEFWIYSRFIFIPLIFGVVLDRWALYKFLLNEKIKQELILLVCSLYLIYNLSMMILVGFNIAPGQLHVYIFMFLATFIVAYVNRSQYNANILALFLFCMSVLQVISSAKIPYIGIIYSAGLVNLVVLFANPLLSLIVAVGYFLFNIYVYLPVSAPTDVFALRALITTLMTYVVLLSFVAAVNYKYSSTKQLVNASFDKQWFMIFLKIFLSVIVFIAYLLYLPTLHHSLEWAGDGYTFNIFASDVGWLLFSISLLLLVVIIVIYTNTIMNNKAMQKMITRVKEAEVKKANFLNNMSHEMRTPLNGILGMCQVLQIRKVSEDLIKPLTIIKFSGNRLKRLIDDSLDIRLLESKEFTIVDKRFFPFRLVESLVANIGVNIKTNVAIYPVINVDKSLCLIGDAGRIGQIIDNLLINSLKFTDSGSIKLTVNYRVNSLIIDVEDTGIGMNQDLLDRLFNTFEQGANSVEVMQQGIGIGLSIIKHLIEKMNGSISVSSKPSVGTHFNVSIPLAKCVEVLK